ncbi:SDR family NAD(P)-dependent oxidoreductase [Nocardia sp. AG03]|uniref:SDR family NAD(P)-dependent oxidoreductase n=1 Tax=Nocardia sp. AG03 TaxID=3025312 RepID=UPI0024188A86|nr:SDR family NAD(P)-dependent oxidoreductase [Nocardia sp. AG03]
MVDDPPRVAIVVGAGSSLGAAVVHRLAGRGFVIAMVDLRASWCDTSLDALGPTHPRPWAFGADVRYLHEAEAAVTRVAETLGPPAVVVNTQFPGRDDSPASARKPGLRAPLLVSRAAGRYLADSGEGRVVNVAQTGRAHGHPAEGPAPRAEVHAVTTTLDEELGARGVSVNTVVAEVDCPGEPVAAGTSALPECCAASVEETADWVDYLVSEAGQHISGRVFASGEPVPQSPPRPVAER